MIDQVKLTGPGEEIEFKYYHYHDHHQHHRLHCHHHLKRVYQGPSSEGSHRPSPMDVWSTVFMCPRKFQGWNFQTMKFSSTELAHGWASVLGISVISNSMSVPVLPWFKKVTILSKLTRSKGTESNWYHRVSQAGSTQTNSAHFLFDSSVVRVNRAK